MKGPSYRPPPLRLADGGSFANPGFAGSLMFIAGGIGGFYVSDVFGSPLSSVAKGLSIIAAGWGVYTLMTGFSGGAPSVDIKRTPEAPPAKSMSPEAFALVSGRIIDPASGTLPPVKSDWFVAPHFDIKAVWRNGSDKEVGNFKYNILVYSIAEGAQEGGPGYVRKIVGDSQIGGLLPGQESGAIPISIDLIKPEPPPISKFYRQPRYFKMYLQLQKIGLESDIPVGDLVEYGPFDYNQ